MKLQVAIDGRVLDVVSVTMYDVLYLRTSDGREFAVSNFDEVAEQEFKTDGLPELEELSTLMRSQAAAA